MLTRVKAVAPTAQQEMQREMVGRMRVRSTVLEAIDAVALYNAGDRDGADAALKRVMLAAHEARQVIGRRAEPAAPEPSSQVTLSAEAFR